jgi:hypothetical protein
MTLADTGGKWRKLVGMNYKVNGRRCTMVWILCTMPLGMVSGQVYTEKQSRHRFAQLNFGLDCQTAMGGTTKYLDVRGNTQSLDLVSGLTPRLLIGGTHFWGHADFYIAIPLGNQLFRSDNQEVLASRGVETVFKYYPLRLEHGKIRPFVGTSLAPFSFKHRNNHLENPEGLEQTRVTFPLMGGLTHQVASHLIELGLAWNYRNHQDYYLSPTLSDRVATPPVYAGLSYRYLLETTLSAEKDWESGRTQAITKVLEQRGRLNGMYLGVGISTAFWLKTSSYNRLAGPYTDKPGISTMPDFTLGYYRHRPDLNVALGYRSYKAHTGAYGTEQHYSRTSWLLEATKGLFDYHGFVPFLGPAVSLENLAFEEAKSGQSNTNAQERKWSYGLTIGWDIRPNRIQTWLLRTNLRWFPNLTLEVEPGSGVAFDNLEFNFIQLVVFPSRLR